MPSFYFFLYLLAIMNQYISVAYKPNAKYYIAEKGTSTNNNNNKQNTLYDFIVVGSGPTGSMTAIGLANRGFKVLLMEAGPDYMSEKVTTPAFYLKATEEKLISWDFYVNHYKNSNIRQNVLYPRVSGLGGCTLHNALIHMYPSKSDFDLMVSLTNDTSWNEHNMRSKYYNRMTSSNTNTLDMPFITPKLVYNLVSSMYSTVTQAADNSQNKIGWLPLTTYKANKLLSLDMKLLDIIGNMLNGIFNLNILESKDINGYFNNNKLANSEEGNFFMPMNVDGLTLKRKGIYEYLKSTSNTNKNLKIITNAHVTRILLDNKNSAYGVEYVSGKYLYKASPLFKSNTKTEKRTIFSKKEIIVSAGTFNTPQLMMLSGIGDPIQLNKLGIKARVNLRGVGLNLQDRYEVALNYKFPSQFVLLNGCNLSTDDACFSNYKQNNKGAYTFNGALLANLMKSRDNLEEPDTVTFQVPFYFSGYRKGMTDDLINHKDMYTFLILKAKTQNDQGSITLKSNNYMDTPNINFNYFAKGRQQDLNAVIKAIKNARSLATKFISDVEEINPSNKFNTDDKLAKYIERTAWGHHACCTMKMGFDNDNLAVLDNKFKVRGVNNLRVADMSMFNKIPGYFPVLFLYMSGAKIADTIADQYQN